MTMTAAFVLSACQRSVLCGLVLSASALTAGAQTPPGTRVLVTPFEAADRDPRSYWLREAAPILLTEGLESRGIDVTTRRERVRAFELLQLSPWSPLSRAMAIKVGQLVGATVLFIGRIDVEDQQLVIRSRAVLLDSGSAGPEIVERGSPDQLFELFRRTARRLVQGAGWQGADAAEGTSPPAVPLEAFENYVKGLVAENPAAQVQLFERALSIVPDYPSARLALWGAHTDLGDHDRALTAVSAVREGSPLARRARFAAAVSEIELKRYDQAFKSLNALHAVVPAASVQNNLGVLQLRRNAPQWGKPAYFFSQAMSADPTDPDYAFNLGYAYWRERDPQAAIYWLREAVRRDPGDRDAHVVLGEALDATGATLEAARERELATRLSPEFGAADPPRSNPELGAVQGLERLKTELEPSFADRLDRVIVSAAQREQRELAAFHLDQGRQLFGQQRDREALSELRRAVYSSPYEVEAHLLIGRIYLRNGRSRDAIEALTIAQWSAESAAGSLLLAEAYLQVGEAGKARAATDRALALDPESADAKKLLERIAASSPR